MVDRCLVVLLGAVLLLPGGGGLSAQALGPSRTGPVIEGSGPVYTVTDPDFATPTGMMRAVWEVALATDDPGQRNPRIESLARFLNMHAQAGVPRENLKLAMVVHGTAGKDLLDHAGYRARHGVDNPNHQMIQDLIGFGVDVVLCGQTQMARGLPRDQLAPGVQVALSAMTALVDFQERGYRLIPF
jgi:intracellular sulfur oxidation DsrE/DsrF family protein